MKEIKHGIEELNRKYGDKKILNCSILGNTLNFDYDKLTFCCSATFDVMGQNPVVCGTDDDIENTFTKDIYISSLLKAIDENQNGSGPCTGCKHLKESDYKQIFYEDIRLSHLIHNNYRGCNSRCVYCFQNVSKIREKYSSVKIIKRLITEDFVAYGSKIDFGGGEPTMLPNMKEYLEFAIDNEMPQLINTSGLLFSEDILMGLKENNLKVQISPDAGTAETYSKVKRQNGFEIVWKNIGKYCAYSKNVLIKYIVFSYNSSNEDIEGFVEHCKNYKVSNVVVSGESEAAWETNDSRVDWTFQEKELNACAYLMYQCLVNNINFKLSAGNLSNINEEKIINLFVVKYLKKMFEKENKKICIFGMGDNGKKIFDFLNANGVEISRFIDNSSYKQNSSYKKCYCTSAEEIDEKKDLIIVSVENFEMIQKQLEKKKVQSIYTFNF